MMPNETRIALNADHRGIARFSSLEDRNFRPLLKQLEQVRSNILDARGLHEDTKRVNTANLHRMLLSRYFSIQLLFS